MVALHLFTLLCTWYIHVVRLPAPPCADKEPMPDSGAENPAESFSQGRSRYRGPSALSCSTSTRAVRCDHSTACGGQGGWATILSPSPVVHAPALNRPTRPSSTKEAALRQQSTVRGVYMLHFLSAAGLLTIIQVVDAPHPPITLQHKLWMLFYKISHRSLKRTSLQR